jgi:hypothetical protein
MVESYPEMADFLERRSNRLLLKKFEGQLVIVVDGIVVVWH